jgi:hypothetical protein
MKPFIKNRRGQFLVLTAFLVVVILSSAIIVSYKRIQENPFSGAITFSSSMAEINNSLSEILGFTVGYYGSIIQVTGNVTYAQMKTVEYLKSGLVTVAQSHVDRGTDFTLDDMNIHTNWFNSISSTEGDITLSYGIPSIGLVGVKFKAYASIKVEILETIGNQARVKVTMNKDRVDLSLLKSNFRFFEYDLNTNRWNYIELPSDPTVTTSGEYLITIPAGINTNAYYLQVVDRRGIMVAAAYVKGSDTLNKKETSYTYTFSWPVEHNAFDPPTDDHTPVVVELLQDGTLRWLGEDLPMVGGATSKRPIPPIPVKGIRVNATLKGDPTKKSFEIPFQVEDWGSNYLVPYGITNNNTIFNENCMIVFLVDHTIENVTVWWDGRDVAKQTSYALPRGFFADDTGARHLSNGVINIDFHLYGPDDYIRASTPSGSVDSQTRFMRVNSVSPVYGAKESYIIYNGVVRDIVQQEAEWSGGVSTSPNMYSHLVFTLPANANYYTYQIRTIFLDVPPLHTRTLSNLNLLRIQCILPATVGPLTENGQTGGIPNTSTDRTQFYNDATHEHQWSEFTDASNNGVGIMYTPSNNDKLYYFDSILGASTGALNILSSPMIELDPVQRAAVNLPLANDQFWKGALVISGGSRLPIYPKSGPPTGLWILVEKLPTITVS